MAEEQVKQGLKNEKVGQVVSTKMQKTIVVEVERRSGTRPAAYVLLYQYRSARWSAIYAGD